MSAANLLNEEFLVNLDGLTTDDLVRYADQLSLAEVTDEDIEVRNQLVRYAVRKSQAIKARASGTIATAMQLEAACDAIYKTLPDWAKW